MDIQAGFGVALQRYYNVPRYPLTPWNAMRAMVNRLRAGRLLLLTCMHARSAHSMNS